MEGKLVLNLLPHYVLVILTHGAQRLKPEWLTRWSKASWMGSPNAVAGFVCYCFILKGKGLFYLVYSSSICIYLPWFVFNRPRDYSQDLDALLISKPSRVSCEMLSIYQDHVCKPIMKSVTGDGSAASCTADVDEAEDYGVSNQRLRNQFMLNPPNRYQNITYPSSISVLHPLKGELETGWIRSGLHQSQPRLQRNRFIQSATEQDWQQSSCPEGRKLFFWHRKQVFFWEKRVNQSLQQVWPWINKQVLHLRNQLEIGMAAAEGFMQRRLFMVCNTKASTSNTAMIVRRALQDAGSRFDSCTMENLHHLGFCDLTKYGRLTAPQIEDIASWCYRTLSLNPNYSTLFES